LYEKPSVRNASYAAVTIERSLTNKAT